MAEFPAMPLWTDAYLGDTRHLTAAQHGAYLLLLMTAWRTPDCALPLDDQKLARWASMDLRTWQRNRDVILSFWDVGDDQKIRQQRQVVERLYVADLTSKKSAAGTSSALKRKRTRSTELPTQLQQTRSTQTQTHILEDTYVSPNRNEVQKAHDFRSDLFDQFWSIYPRQRRGDKKRTFTIWQRRIRDGCDPVEMCAGLQPYLTSRDVAEGFAKNAATWLLNSCWEDQPIQKGQSSHDKPKPMDGWLQAINDFGWDKGDRDSETPVPLLPPRD